MISRLRDRPIRNKLILSSGLASSLALALACAAFILHEWLTFPASFGHELGTEAEIIGRNSSAALLFADPSSAATTLEALSARESILAAAIYTKEGRRFAAYRATAPLSAVLPEIWPLGASDGGRDGDRITVRRMVVFQGELIGSVVIHADLWEMSTRLTEYALIALLVLATSLAAAVWLADRLQGTISRPILHLTEIARRVSELKDYAVRAEPAGNDEIGFLVRTFNQMLDAIQGRER